MALCSALKDMEHFLSDKWSNTEDVFDGVFKDCSDNEEGGGNINNNKANASRVECQYAIFLWYLRERSISEIHREFLESLRGEVSVFYNVFISLPLLVNSQNILISPTISG